MKVPWDVERAKLDVTKHFALKYMKAWGWDFYDLREAIREAYKIEKVGKNKYELYVQKDGYKKMITVYYASDNELRFITGSRGGKRT